jgi:hypothetical protein
MNFGGVRVLCGFFAKMDLCAYDGGNMDVAAQEAAFFPNDAPFQEH